MKIVVAILLLSLLGSAEAQTTGLQQPTRSQSGQFLAYDVPGGGPAPHSFFLRTNQDLVELEPWLLVISCERIKEALWRELNITAPAPGKIYLFLYRAQTSEDPIVISPARFGNGWNYRVDLPDLISRHHYFSALTHVLLLELANRNSPRRSAEIPLWLREGIAQHVLVSRQIELIPLIPKTKVSGMTVGPMMSEGRWLDPLARAHEVMKANPALTFEELSWPSRGDMYGDPGEQFRCSAQLFVARLLALKNGHNLMRYLIESLPEYYNWQLALLRAYHDQFSRPLDIEKWWAINVVQFNTHTLSPNWPLAESVRRLEAAIRPAVEVRTSTNQMPLRTDTTLQAIIRDWKSSQRDDMLQQIADELGVLKIRLASDVAAIAENYQHALTAYLKDRWQAANTPESKRRSAISEASVTRNTLKMLDALDARRASLRPVPNRPRRNGISASLDSSGIKSIVP